MPHPPISGDPRRRRIMVAMKNMTLRDWFAGQALTGWLSDPDVGLSGPEGIERVVATTMYQYADAMLKAREDDP